MGLLDTAEGQARPGQGQGRRPRAAARGQDRARPGQGRQGGRREDQGQVQRQDPRAGTGKAKDALDRIAAQGRGSPAAGRRRRAACFLTRTADGRGTLRSAAVRLCAHAGAVLAVGRRPAPRPPVARLPGPTTRRRRSSRRRRARPRTAGGRSRLAPSAAPASTCQGARPPPGARARARRPGGLSAADVGGAQRAGRLRVEGGGALVEIAGGLERAAGGAVAHHEQGHPPSARPARSRPASAHWSTPSDSADAERLDRGGAPAVAVAAAMPHSQRGRQQPGLSGPSPSRTSRSTPKPRNAAAGARRVAPAGLLVGGADDDQQIGPGGGEHRDGVGTGGAGGVELGGGACGDLGHEQGRAGTDGGGDEHGRNPSGTPFRGQSPTAARPP